MTNILASNHLMCSQSVNHQDLNPSACIVAEPELDVASRDNYSQPPNQLSDMGMRYMNIPNDDNRFNSETVNSQSPVYSLESSLQNNPQSTNLGISPYNSYYQPPAQNLSTFPNGQGAGGSAYFAPNSIFSSISDNIKPPRLSSLQTSSRYSQSRDSPVLSHISPPLSVRDLYSSHTPGTHPRPPDLMSRSPTLSGNIRSLPISPTSTGGFTSPIPNMNDSLGVNPVPPLNDTELHYTLTTSDGQTVKPEIHARIDKGFFMADNDWTCYRRNYFSLNCSYSLIPTVPNGSIYLQPHGAPALRVHAFSMSIAAVVDGRDGKPIELVQHTPKRDKGPQEKPARIVLAPRPQTAHGAFDGIGGRSNIYDTQGFNSNPNQPATEATFERIQFKSATANNGKRRAAQQYYHLLVELFADVGNQHIDQYIKVATRMSVPMVVRGRSPGHYQSERRGSSNTSNGPGGTSGGSAGSYASSGSLGRTSGIISMGSVTSSMLPGSFNNNYDCRSNQYRSTIPPLNTPIESTISLEEPKHVEDNAYYLYFPGNICEGSDSRYHLPMPGYNPSKFKNECGLLLPSLSSSQDIGGLENRHCGRWNNLPESKGYFSTTLAQHGMNVS
ncbi:putative ndt80 like dna-binding family protein [Golovinomyces cichoracearum]|uniref:Putative ndt80 like dna-binding family protein n=1 Tax=Golovinomyces cichoracearum TaxID=62708 RepID=A0A420HMH2_9PEZI|nr:putative ndt80 like dna-binding family protein [Golovinomyces cichoracearum]